MSFQVKVAFAFTAGAEILIFGRCREITLVAGLAPNVVELTVPKSEFAKFAGDCNRTGSIQLFASNPDIPDAILYGWSVMYVTDGLVGKQPGDAVPSVQEKVIVLADRRWEFTGGRGGHYSRAPMNVPLADGTMPSNIISAYAMCVSLCSRLQYASGLTRLATVPEIWPLTDDAGPPLKKGARPINVKWDMIHCPTELNRLLNECGFVFTLKATGGYECYKRGDGDLPNMTDPFVGGAARELASDTVYHRTNVPHILIVTSGRQKSFVEVEVTGVVADDTTAGWQFVSDNRDGSLVQVDHLDWLPVGSTPQGVFRNKLRPVEEEAWAGYESLFCIIRLSGPDRAKMLPMLNRSCTALADGDGVKRGANIRVLAKVSWWDGTAGVWRLGEAYQDITGFSVAPTDGLIWFERPLGNLDRESDTQRYGNHWKDLQGDDLSVIFAHESYSAGNYADSYNAAYTLDANGNVISYDMAAAMDPNAQNVRVLEVTSLLEYVNLFGDSLNKTDLDARALEIAKGILQPAQTSRVRKFVGFFQVSPSGKYSAVHWDIDNCITSVEEAMFDSPGSTFMQKETYKQFMDLVKGIPAKNVADSNQAKNGGRDTSAHNPVTPGPSEIPRDPSTNVLIGGIIAYRGDVSCGAGDNYIWDASGLGKPGTAAGGWALCNGHNGTEDWTDRTPVGFGALALNAGAEASATINDHTYHYHSTLFGSWPDGVSVDTGSNIASSTGYDFSPENAHRRHMVTDVKVKRIATAWVMRVS
jgi:hypothetical protein